MTRSFVPATLFGIALLATACIFEDPAKFPRTIVTRIPFASIMPLDVQSANGSLAVATVPGDDLVVTAEFRCTSEERARRVAVHAAPNAEGIVEIRALWPDDRRSSNESCAFTVAAPALGAARLRTSNGAIRVDGATTALDAMTSNGSVTVHGAVPNGTIVTSNGGIDLDGPLGTVTARTSNGHLSVTFAAGAAGARSFETSNGPVTLNGLRHAGGVITGSTSNGEIRLPAPTGNQAAFERSPRGFTLTFDAAGPKTTVTTSNGDLSGSY